MTMWKRTTAALAALVFCVGAAGFTPAPQPAPARFSSDAAATTTELAGHQTPKPANWIGVQVKGDGRREYTDAQQVERLLALLPSPADAVDKPDKALGSNPAELEVHRGDTVTQYFVYSQGFALERSAGGETWYAVSGGLWRLLTTLTDWQQYPVYDTTYKDEKIAGMYSFQYKNRSYHAITSPEKIAEVVAMLADKQPDETATNGSVGFLIITEEDGYDLYFDASSDQELIDLSVARIRDSAPQISWLVYMDTSKIASISATASIGAASLAGDSAYKTATLNTSDRDSISRIASFLKGMKVKDDPVLSWDPVDLGGKGKQFTLDITFESGIVYHITADDQTLKIACPDMPENITYACNASRLQAFSDLVSLMPGAKLA